MRPSLRSFAALVLFTPLFVSTAGCDGEPTTPAGCPAGDEVRGACAGVPETPLCDDDTCSAGVECVETVTVSDDASLSSALGSARKGTCVALEPGSYGAVTLPSGVHLLGKSAADVSVQGLTIAAGDAAFVRGIHVGADGIDVKAAQVTLDSVLVSGAEAVGVHVEAGGHAQIVRSTVEGSEEHGLLVDEGGALSMEAVIVQENQGPGVWVACSPECGCLEPTALIAQTSIVRDNHVGGIVVFGAAATIQGVDVSGTLVGDDFGFGLGGGGLTIAGCADAAVSDLRVSGSQSYGMLVDDSTATVGDPTGETPIEITGNEIGVWIQNISKSTPASVTLESVTVDGNAGVGIGTAGDTVGLIICKTAITGTQMSDLVVAGGGSQEIGDGLLWLDGSEITIDDLTMSGNARASIVIDGEATGSMSDVTLSGGDEAKGVVQQSYSGGAQPVVKAGAPAISTSADGLFSIPKAPSVLPRSL